MKRSRTTDPNVLITVVSAFIVAMVAGCILLLLRGQIVLFYVFAGVTVLLCVFSFILMRRAGNAVSAFYRSVIRKLTIPNSDLFNHFDLPVIVLQDEQVVWYNARFRTNVLKGDDLVGRMPDELLSQSARSALRLSGKAEVEVVDRYYTVYASDYVDNNRTFTVLYYADVTDLKTTALEYDQTRGVVAILSIDSYDEITADMAESAQAVFKGGIDQQIEQFSAEIDGITKKLKSNRYISVLDERSLNRLKAGKFAILDKVRALQFDGAVHATLSIGIGRGAPTLKECEALALQALEMCQGRGGDQVAIKSAGDTYEFFGGVSSSGVERRGKVKTRVVASALRELIGGSDRVFLMGHKYGDIDSLGACYGLWRCCVSMEKESYIVLDEASHLAQSLIEKIKREAGEEIIISPDRAQELLTRKSLLILCDTHRRDFSESGRLCDECLTTVVIDHHRKNIDYIDNSVMFYHEPYASSTCEMVAELIQYIDNSVIGPHEADALLAGIMLDTRNYVLRTGVRTFEASAYLRGRGADPVAVKKLFSDSIEVYRQRAMLVSAATFHNRCAIAAPQKGVSVLRVAASQAADELLNIENTDAAFVLFPAGDGVNISARSLGAVNVQLIMEALGGGGHHTMAAAQLSACSVEQAKARLLEVLNTINGKEEIE